MKSKEGGKEEIRKGKKVVGEEGGKVEVKK